MRKTGHAYYGKNGVLGHTLDAIASLEDVLDRLSSLLPRVHRHVTAHLAEPVAGHPRFALVKLGELFHDVGKPPTAAMGEDGRLHFYGHEYVGAGIARKTARRWSTHRNRFCRTSSAGIATGWRRPATTSRDES